MGYATGYDLRQRFGDLPGELHFDENGGGLVRAVVSGTVTILKWTREEYSHIPAEAGCVDVTAKVVGRDRQGNRRR